MPNDYGSTSKWTMTGFGKAGTYSAGALDMSLIFNAFMGYTNRKSTEAIEEVLKRLVRYAKQACPVRTGMLQDSITYYMVPEQRWGAYGSDCSYARWVNDGTSRMTGFHFMEIALAKAKIQSMGE